MEATITEFEVVEEVKKVSVAVAKKSRDSEIQKLFSLDHHHHPVDFYFIVNKPTLAPLGLLILSTGNVAFCSTTAIGSEQDENGFSLVKSLTGISELELENWNQWKLGTKPFHGAKGNIIFATQVHAEKT